MNLSSELRNAAWTHSDQSVPKDGMINRFFITGQTETETQTNRSTKQNLNYYKKQNLTKEDRKGTTIIVIRENIPHIIHFSDSSFQAFNQMAL